eukprot:EG_transcript_8538
MAAPRPMGGIGFAIKPQPKEDRKYDFSKDAGGEEPKRVDVIQMSDTYKPHGRKGCISEAEVLKRDLEGLPDESYSVHPSDIGMALLRGMLPGWQPGDKIGSRGLQQPIEYVKRDFRLGLGADPETPSAARRRKGKWAAEPHLVLAEDAAGNRRSYKFLDERLVKRRKLGLHAPVLILAGRHREMLGTVVRWAEEEAAEIAVALDLNQAEVTVAKADVRLADAEDYRRFGTLGSLPESLRPAATRVASPQPEGEEPAGKGEDRLASPTGMQAGPTDARGAIPVDDSDSEADGRQPPRALAAPRPSPHPRPAAGTAGSHPRTGPPPEPASREGRPPTPSPATPHRPPGGSAGNGHRRESDGRRKGEATPAPLTWVLRRLCVRVVARGPHYTKKGHVYDITDRCRCSVRLEDGTLVDGVTEDQLETIVPKQAGQSVMVVRGKYRGRVARLHSRDSTKERCVLQIDTHVESMPFDNVCVFLDD